PGGYQMKNVRMPGYKKYESEGFATPSGKMEFDSIRLQRHGLDGLPVYKEPVLSPQGAPEAARSFPLVLGTGSRLPMFIHSRTFRNAWDSRLNPAPFVGLNRADAAARGI